MTEIEVTDGPLLTIVQRQRAEALDVARQALSNRQIFAGNNVNGWSVSDLTYVADWVLGNPDQETTEMKPGAPWDNTEDVAAVSWDDPPATIGSHSVLDGGFPSELDSSTSDEQDDDTAVLPEYPEEALPR